MARPKIARRGSGSAAYWCSRDEAGRHGVVSLAAFLGLVIGIMAASTPGAEGARAQTAVGVKMPFTVTTGHVIRFQPVGDLDCDGLRRKLAEIDATGYRGHRPRPADRRDRPLFDYENAVAHDLYTRCNVRLDLRPGEPAGVGWVFRHGFKSRPSE